MVMGEFDFLSYVIGLVSGVLPGLGVGWFVCWKMFIRRIEEVGI